MSKVDLDDSWWNGVTNGLTNRLMDNAISTVASWFGGGVQNASFKIAAKQCLTLGWLSLLDCGGGGCRTFL